MLYYAKKLLNNGEECVFRTPVGIQDARSLLSLSARLQSETGYLQPMSEKDPDTETALLELAADSSDLLVLVAEKNAVLVGSACLMNCGKENGAGEIGVAVIQEEWGHGIGSHLLRILLGKARSAGYPHLHLTVRPDNVRAQQLYRKAGFTVPEQALLPHQPFEMILEIK